VPGRVRLLHVQLNERTGQFLAFPRRGRFAGAEADDRVPNPEGLPGLQRQVPGDAVALVQETKHGNPLSHGRDPRHLTRSGLRQCNAVRLLAFLGLAIAAGR